jgi:hypothetical protein
MPIRRWRIIRVYAQKALPAGPDPYNIDVMWRCLRYNNLNGNVQTGNVSSTRKDANASSSCHNASPFEREV